MTARFFIIFILIALKTLPVFSAQDTVIIGVDVNSIAEIRLRDDRFVIEFQLWFRYKNDTLDVFNSIGVLNSRAFNKGPVRKEKIGDQYWSTAKCNADIIYEWDLRSYPFIAQDVKIYIIDTYHDSKELVFIADSVNSKLNKRLILNDWDLTSFGFHSGKVESGSSFGNPSAGSYIFPAGVINFNLERKNPWLLIEKLLLPLWVSFLIALVVFWIVPTNVDPRFGLPSAALFASVANKYIISEVSISLPYQIYVERVHNHSFAFILCIIIISVISLYYCENGKIAIYKKIDKYSFYLILTAYLIDNLLMTFQII